MRPTFWTVPQPGAEAYRRLPEKTAELEARIRRIADAHSRVKFASSLAVEDLTVTHAIAATGAPIAVFTLDTGRLNPETLLLLERVRERYPAVSCEVYRPDPAAVDAYVAAHSLDAFYESVDLRRECCRIRKIEPLNRALADADAWLTGQRRGQSVTRGGLEFAEHDAARGIAKYNPLFDWTEEEVWAFVLHNNIPFNDLYNQGYPSIGCAPCTIPVKAGDDIRAGRWWWESRDSKECGLHK